MLNKRGGTADLVLRNGPIYSADEADNEYSAMAISGGRIIALGKADDMEPLIDEDTGIVDLAGRCAVPGIVDSHNHLPTAGAMMHEGVLLFDAASISQLQRKVADKARKLAPGQWLRGAGWIESQFEERRMPTRWDLDDASPDNPVVLNRLFGMCVVNSRALELAGIGKDTPDPERGKIDRDEQGRPTGVLRAGARVLLQDAMPQQEETQQVKSRERYIKEAANEYVRWGITSLIDPGVDPLTMRAYQNVREAGDLPLRINMMPVWHGLRSWQDEALEGRLGHLGIYTNFGDEWLRMGALKMAIDGGLGSKTALMHEPYIDGTTSEIPLRLDSDRLQQWFTEGQSAGWSIGIHCCGDLAQDMACEAFDGVVEKLPAADVRHNIIHGYFATDKALDTMQRRNIAVSAQPGFIWIEGDIYFDVVPEEKLSDFKPLKTYSERGILVAANSDMTSNHYNPFWGIHSAVTRKTARGRVLGTSEAVDRMHALRMFTQNGAYLTFEENEKGSLELGKLADVAVLNDDFAAVGSDELRDLRVDMTIIDGEVVYRRR